jgi:hypothetical protein
MSYACSLQIETARTADKWITALVKTEKPFSRNPDPDAYAYTNLSRRLHCGTKPQRTFSAQVHPVQNSGNTHRRSEPSWPARKLSQRSSRFFACNFSRSFGAASARRFGAAMKFHPFDSFERLHSTQKNSFADPFALSGNIQHEVVSVNKINVRVSAFQKKRAIPRRLSAKRVASRVAYNVGFRFNDSSAKPHMRQVMHQRFADQKTRQFDGIDRQLAAAKAANPNFSVRDCHAIRSIIRTVRARLILFLHAAGKIDERQIAR